MLHSELINSFPSDSQERVRIEIGIIEDLCRSKPIEMFYYTFNINQYVTFIEEKIDSMDCVPTLKVIYPFGNPLIIEGENNPLKFEKNYIEIEFF